MGTGGCLGIRRIPSCPLRGKSTLVFPQCSAHSRAPGNTSQMCQQLVCSSPEGCRMGPKLSSPPPKKIKGDSSPLLLLWFKNRRNPGTKASTKHLARGSDRCAPACFGFPLCFHFTGVRKRLIPQSREHRTSYQQEQRHGAGKEHPSCKIILEKKKAGKAAPDPARPQSLISLSQAAGSHPGAAAQIPALRSGSPSSL